MEIGILLIVLSLLLLTLSIYISGEPLLETVSIILLTLSVLSIFGGIYMFYLEESKKQYEFIDLDNNKYYGTLCEEATRHHPDMTCVLNDGTIIKVKQFRKVVTKNEIKK